MSEKVKFLSIEWETKMKELLSANFIKKGGVTTDFLQVVESCPDGTQRWMLLKLEKSIFVSYEVGEGELPDSKFKAFAPYSTFIKIVEGTLDGSKALITGEFRLEGNMVKALGLIGTYNRLETAQRSIPTEF
jgi:putative sterol carrier protein